jgi:hypothetical protein
MLKHRGGAVPPLLARSAGPARPHERRTAIAAQYYCSDWGNSGRDADIVNRSSLTRRVQNKMSAPTSAHEGRPEEECSVCDLSILTKRNMPPRDLTLNSMLNQSIR